MTLKDAIESNFGGTTARHSSRQIKRRKLLQVDQEEEQEKELKKNMEVEDEEIENEDEYRNALSLFASSGGSSSSAYMLAYVRKRDLDKVMNSSFLVPGGLEKRIQQEILEEEEKRRKIENERMMVNVAIWTERHVCFVCVCVVWV